MLHGTYKVWVCDQGTKITKSVHSCFNGNRNGNFIHIFSGVPKSKKAAKCDQSFEMKNLKIISKKITDNMTWQYHSQIRALSEIKNKSFIIFEQKQVTHYPKRVE